MIMQRLFGGFAALTLALLPSFAVNAAPPSKLTDDAELVETRTQAPKLAAAAEYKMKDGVLEIELSEYAGYAGLIVANGGMEPNDNSVFAKKFGFKLKLSLSEEESWSSLNAGRIGGSATTVDVLAAYGRQFQVVVPAMIGFSRGADGIVVRSEIKKINDLKGKVLATAQFTESDFLLRYLAQEAGLGVKMLGDLSEKPDPDKVNVVYCADGFGAGDLFLRDVKAGRNRLAGCVTWAPKTNEVAEGSAGKAKILTTNKNLLVVADILVLNKAFAANNPKIVAGLAQGLLEGNNAVRTSLDANIPVIAKAFKWTPEKVKSEMSKVHLANLPESQAFFAGTIDAAGSFGYIYETAGYVYGADLVGHPPEAERFLDTKALAAAEKSGQFKDQKTEITPLRSKVGAAEINPDDATALLSKDIRFSFTPNSSKLEESALAANSKGLDSIAQLLKVSPGSMVLLRGHADGSQIEKFRKEGGEARAREVVLALKNLSKARCTEVKQVLQDKYKLEEVRIEIQAVGADEPTGKGADADRRVEVQWFTVE